MPTLHPTAVLDPQVELSDDVEVGPYAVIQGHVVLGPGTAVFAHSVLQGHTVVGAGCRIGPGAYVGGPPQHLARSGEGTSLVIGDGAIIRECTTIHRAITPGIEHATRIGPRCFVMANAHIGHDCVIEEDAIVAGGAMIAGHCHIGRRAFIGGAVALHQFVRVGRLAMIRGNEQLSRDALPFAAIQDEHHKGYNAIGCRRAGLSREAIAAIRQVYRLFGQHRTMPAVVQAIQQQVPPLAEVQEMLEFIRTSKRGITPHARSSAESETDAEG